MSGAGRVKACHRIGGKITGFTYILIYAGMKVIMACLCQWLAWDTYSCWCMYVQYVHYSIVRIRIFAFDILNRKRIAHGRPAFVWIIGRYIYAFSYDFNIPFLHLV
jgi:hypothetical protein